MTELKFDLKERRKHPRVKSINLIYYNFFDQKEYDKRQGIAKTIDLSECGILLECGYPFPLHSVLEITLALGERLITIRGEVVRAMLNDNSNYLLGLEISPSTEEDKEKLVKFIKENK